MEYFHIEGGRRLGGAITPAGNKNAAPAPDGGQAC